MCRSDRTLWRTVTILPTGAVLSTVLSAFLVNSPAFAGIGVGVAPTYPPLVVVGNTSLAVSLSLTNVSTAPESGGPITLSLIRHTPSCVSDTTPCLPGDEDPGVFLIKGFPDGKAHGRAGTACGDPNVPGGMNFTIGPPNATTGEVEFIPDSGSVILTCTERCVSLLHDRLFCRCAEAAQGWRSSAA